MFGFGKKKAAAGKVTPQPSAAVPETMTVAKLHAVTRNPMCGPYPADLEIALFGMGCFWGVERLFWQQPGVYTTAVGYAGGETIHPTYKDVCSGATGHNEVVQIVFDPKVISYSDLLRWFWESHDPTQGMRQGPDRGSQYRSGIYTHSDDQRAIACSSRAAYQTALSNNGYAAITTEILPAPTFYFAEDYHQQYLHKNPAGYCSMHGTGTRCVIQPLEKALPVKREVFV